MREEMKQAVERLSRAPYRAIPRMGLDMVLWGAALAVALWAGQLWVNLLAIAFIGALPLHDLLVYGHEGTHGLISRNRSVNGLLTWFTHALVGLSGAAYRKFHLDHHRHAHTLEDPEYKLLNRLIGGAPGWAYLLIPLVSQIAVNAYPFYRPARPEVRWRTLRDLAGMLLLHAVLAWALGRETYLLFVAAPVFTSLSVVVVLRSVCEHHAAFAGSRWTNTRAMVTNRLVELLWSNVNYHFEHHMFPKVPCRQLPELRRLLESQYAERRTVVDRGYIRTAFALLREPAHFKQIN